MRYCDSRRVCSGRAILAIISGTPIGLASGATGGGSAEPMYPTTIEELTSCGSRKAYSVTADSAAYNAINDKSDKSLVGQNGAALNGKGLRFQDVSNIGGDAIAISDAQDIWIDQVTTSSLGRQHYSFGTGASTGITISNSFMDGETSYSSTCDGHTYWGLELVDSGDRRTFYSMRLFKGNCFLNSPIVVVPDFLGSLVNSDADHVSDCTEYLGQDCVQNVFSNSGSFSRDDISFLSFFQGKTDIAEADPASFFRTQSLPQRYYAVSSAARTVPSRRSWK
ncbi:polysaccharide lyase family 1 protein [Xylaria nigripes]|nr:polysaccharide lyase family 1 protein [Xylaria nigripes]